ncbi:MAG TPA: TMEM175 family protein, partial [Flavisolibacter sp.]|nr:TMEM175 family protein [Flavisolibacter sp.]
VPQTFKELQRILQSFLPFVATVCLVMLFWYQQNRYFRHYGLNDKTVIVLNMVLMLMVLFYVYPLKFLFSLLFGMLLSVNFFQQATTMGEVVLNEQEFPQLVLVYSAGYTAIWLVFYLLYRHAWKQRRPLALNFYERNDTRRQVSGALIDVLIGVLCSLFAWAGHPGLSGLCFFLLLPALLLNDWWFKRKLFQEETAC